MKMLSHSSSLTVVLTIRRSNISSLQATVKALAAQTLPSWAWKLIVIDEREDINCDLTALFRWHPTTRIIADQSNNSLPPSARAVLGIKTDLAVFIDGQTILAPNYFSKAVKIAEAYPLVGIFGGNVSMAVQGNFPKWKAPFLRYFGAKKASEVAIHSEAKRAIMPACTGYVVHREHLRRFSHLLMRHSLFRDHDFAEKSHSFDYRAALARSIAQSGSSLGLFPELQLQSIVTKDQLKTNSLKERVRADAFSAVLERFIWTGSLPPMPKRRSWEQVAERWLSFWRLDPLVTYRRAHRIGQFEATQLALHLCHRPVAQREAAKSADVNSTSKATA